ncbi:MAG TPA: hypothetical protein VFM31_12945 [Nitrososphaeraceae archaeon]|nr:hypothetical protein [Nitrososphaeraceae archaeon]
MDKEGTISKLKWVGVSAIISSVVSFLLIPLLTYFSDKILKFDLSTVSPYIIPIILGFVGSVILILYYILSTRNKNNNEK